MVSLTEKVLKAVENSPSGIATLDVLKSLRLCDEFTLKTTLSRFCKSGRIIHLKRGVYSSKPMRDVFVAAQSAFGGYLGFSSALYIHKLITEVPFSITIVTPSTSALKVFPPYEFRAISMKKKAVGFENVEDKIVSTRAKTLFDCLYLERYSVEPEKLIGAYMVMPLSHDEIREFDSYVQRFIPKGKRRRFERAKERILGNRTV